MKKNYFIFWLLIIPILLIATIISGLCYLGTNVYSYLKKDKEDF